MARSFNFSVCVEKDARANNREFKKADLELALASYFFGGELVSYLERENILSWRNARRNVPPVSGTHSFLFANATLELFRCLVPNSNPATSPDDELGSDFTFAIRILM